MSFKRSILTLGITVSGLFPAIAQNTLAYVEPESHFRNGLEYFEKNNFLAARQEFDAYLKNTSGLLPVSDYNSVTAEYYIAVTGLYLNYPEAEMQVDRFVRNHSEHPKAQLIFADLGRYYYEAGDYEKAVGYLEKAVANTRNYTKNVESSYRLAMSYYHLKRPLDALPLLNRIKQDGTFAYAGDASYLAGVINYQNGNYNEAYLDFVRVQNHPTYAAQVPNWIVSSLYHQQKYQELLAYGESVLKKGNDANLTEVALYVAEVLYEKSDFKSAVPAYERYFKLKGGNPDKKVALHYGHALFRNESYKAAADALKGIAAGRDSVGQYAAYLSGISYLNNENPGFALTSFDHASKLTFNPTIQEEATFNRAKLLIETGGNNEAIKVLNEFNRIFPGSSHEEEVSELIASAYSASSNSSGAIAYIEGLKKRTPQINATYQRLTFNQAISDFNAERYVQAVVNFDKSLKYPVDEELVTEATYFKAEAYSNDKKTDQALAIYTQLSKNNRAGVFGRKSLYAIGYIYYNQKAYSKALPFFRDFTNNVQGIDAQTVEDGYVRLADCYLAAKNYDEAIRTYEKIGSQGKSDKDYALFQKGRAYVYMGRSADARRQFDLLISQYPQSSYRDDAMFQLADVDFQDASYSQAVKGYTRLINDQPNSPMVPTALLRRAQSYYNIQVYEHAITDFRRILSDFPSSPAASSALEGVQEALNAAGRPEEFSDVLGTVRKNNPKNDKLEDVEFQNANNLYLAGKYANAITAFNQFISGYPASKNNYDARYYIAASYDKSGNAASAIQGYSRVIQENRSQFVTDAAERAAALEIAAGNFKNAVTNYRILLRNAENKKEQVVAWAGLMDTYYKIKNADSTLFFAREVANAGNIIPGMQGKAQLYQGKVPYEKGDYTKALEEFNKIAKANTDEVGAEAKYLACEVLFKTKKYKEAEAGIFELSKKYDGFDYWRVRSFLLLADVYLATNEKNQAKATLTSIIENTDDQDIIAKAKGKLAEIERN